MEKELRVLICAQCRSQFGGDPDSVVFGMPPETIDADYAVECFSMSKLFRKSPADIARTIANMDRPEWVDSIIPAGPYINIKLTPAFLERTVFDQIDAEQTRFGWQKQDTPARVIVEYSSPNTNKPLHLGHIRNNVLGVAVVNLLRAMGNDVIPASILNDRGIHICKAMVAYRKFFEGQTPETAGMKGDHFVGMTYVRFDQESRGDESLMEEARAMLRAWEAGDPATRDLWKRMNRWVTEGFEQTYARLGSTFELVQFESDMYQEGKSLALDGVQKGIFYRREDGSIWFDLRDIGLDEKAIVRGDGTSLYLTQDLGVAVDRARRYHPDRVIYVVGSEQIYHFKALFAALGRLGFEWAAQCVHLSYGMVYLPEGKMKSREGKVIDADNLMDDMTRMALDVMEESHLQIDDADRRSIAEAIGIGAIKYFILKVGALKDIHFDPRGSLSFDGSTGAYLQYTHARIRSILNRAGEVPDTDCITGWLTQKEETTLLRKLLRFPRCLSDAAADLNPSRLALYLWELAKLYNGFYTNHRVLDAPGPEIRAARLRLCRSVAMTLRCGLELLGIRAVERM